MSDDARAQKATLTVERVTRPLFQLCDGSITADRERALADLRRER